MGVENEDRADASAARARRLALEADVRRFKARGGKVQPIKRGVSGVKPKPKRKGRKGEPMRVVGKTVDERRTNGETWREFKLPGSGKGRNDDGS